MTGRDLVSASLRLIGAIAPGESLAAGEATDGLAALNRMISSWSNEALLIYAKVRETLPLVPGTAAYTVGVTGNLNTTRPLKIESALIRNSSVSPAVEYPIRMLSLDEWTSIAVKDLTTELPTDMYVEGTTPLETVNLFPVPSVAHTLVLWSWKPLTEITTLDDVIAFPPGYERALIFNLAMDIAPEYGKAIPDAVASGATDSRTAIKRMNIRQSYLRPDSIPCGVEKRFNVFTGGWR